MIHVGGQGIVKLEYSRLERLEFLPTQYDARYLYTEDLKDPCVLQIDGTWHLYGSLGSSRIEMWQIFHATATHRDGPWTVQPPVTLDGMETVLEGIDDVNSAERGIYDPHFSSVRGKKYLTYSAARRIGPVGDRYMADPDIFLAESVGNDWSGPWERHGLILSRDDVPHHNPRHHQDYEWGLEGYQLLELPNGSVLMVVVCFKPNEVQGLRQRIFLPLPKIPKGRTGLWVLLSSRQPPSFGTLVRMVTPWPICILPMMASAFSGFGTRADPVQGPTTSGPTVMPISL